MKAIPNEVREIRKKIKEARKRLHGVLDNSLAARGTRAIENAKIVAAKTELLLWLTKNKKRKKTA